MDKQFTEEVTKFRGDGWLDWLQRLKIWGPLYVYHLMQPAYQTFEVLAQRSGDQKVTGSNPGRGI